MAIENASQERINIGPDDKPEYVNKYSMRDLLDQNWKFPADESWGISEDELKGLEGLKYDEVE